MEKDLKRDIGELEAEKQRWLHYMKDYTISGVYNGPELFLNLYKTANQKLEDARRQFCI